MDTRRVASRTTSILAVITAALALAACHRGTPKVCRTDPKGFACADYHRMKAYKNRAEQERKMALDPPKPLKPKPFKPRPIAPDE